MVIKFRVECLMLLSPASRKDRLSLLRIKIYRNMNSKVSPIPNGLHSLTAYLTVKGAADRAGGLVFKVTFSASRPRPRPSIASGALRPSRVAPGPLRQAHLPPWPILNHTTPHVGRV